MFILSTLTDLVTLPPHSFSQPTATALEDTLNAKYSNKVVYNVGLCICLYDLLQVSEGLIGHGDGSANVHVTFRLIVFRPFKGEILTGRISSSTPAGIKVRLDFFEDILIPGHLLFDGSVFDISENVWVWHNEDTQLYMDKGEVIRFKVENERFTDQTPALPGRKAAGGGAGGGGGGEESSGPGDGPDGLLLGNGDGMKEPPYQINASCREAGLGLVSWW